MAQYVLLVWARGNHRERGRVNIRKCVQLVVVTALLLGFTSWFDGTTPGKLFEGAVYAWFQTLLAGDGALPVVVVDISALDSQQHLDIHHRPEGLSPRQQLLKLIDVIAADRPAAIGIDVDFSPDENGWTERGGPQLFDELGVNGKVPVYLGVDRTRYGKSESWLGDANYKGLAVMLALRREDNRKMPLWIGDPDVCLARVAKMQAAKKVGETSPESGSGPADCLFSMSAALATDHLNREELGPCGWKWWKCFAPSFTIDKEAEQLRSRFFMVDYGAVQRLVDQSPQAVVSGDQVRLKPKPTSPSLLNQIVILGNTQWENTLDKYPVPPLQNEVPGVFFHASGVYTLIKGPLREITTWGRTLLDVLAVMMCLAVEQYVHRRFPKVEQDRVRWTAIWLVIVIILAGGGYGLLRFERILWTDWPWVSITLLLHGWLDRKLEQHDQMFQNTERWLGLGSAARGGGVA